MTADYTQQDLAGAFAEAGLRRGDVVFSHSSVGFLGTPASGRTAEAVCRTVLGAFEDVLGPDGTLVVPTFTYSACKGQPFDPLTTPSTCGLFTEFVRKLPRSLRSRDPIFSVAAVGGRAEEITRDAPSECFGEGSVWHRLHDLDALICNINLDAGSTFLHWVERRARVAYRYDKLFAGEVVGAAGPEPAPAVFFCQDLSNPDTVAAFEPFHALATDRGVARTRRVGRGAIVAVRARAAHDLLTSTLRSRPWLLTAAGREGREPRLQLASTGGLSVALPPGLDAVEVFARLRRLRCDLVSPGAEAVQRALLEGREGAHRRWPTGRRVGEHLVPESWACTAASVVEADGRPLWTLADDPHAVAPYSESADVELDGATLSGRSDAPDGEVPGTFLMLRRSWALSLPPEARARVRPDARYRVTIRAARAQAQLVTTSVEHGGGRPALTCVVRLGPEGGGAMANAAAVAGALAAVDRARISVRLVVVTGVLGLRAWAEAAPHEAAAALVVEPAAADAPSGLSLPPGLSPAAARWLLRWAAAREVEVGPAARGPQGLLRLSDLTTTSACASWSDALADLLREAP